MAPAFTQFLNDAWHAEPHWFPQPGSATPQEIAITATIVRAVHCVPIVLPPCSLSPTLPQSQAHVYGFARA